MSDLKSTQKSVQQQKTSSKTMKAKSIRNVLLPTDFSEYSYRALKFFMEWIYRDDDVITFMFVEDKKHPFGISKAPVPLLDPQFVQRLSSDTEPVLRADLQGLLEYAESARILSSCACVRAEHSSPADAILSRSDVSTDVIVMGTRVYSHDVLPNVAQKKILHLTCVSEKVVHGARMPVLVVK